MKLNRLNNSHFILAGAIATIVALFVYMWLDMRDLTSAKPTQEHDGATTTQAGTGDVAAITYSAPAEKESPLQREGMKHEDLVKASASFFEKQAGTRMADPSYTQAAGSNTDDWMFERGKDVEGEPADNGNISVPE